MGSKKKHTDIGNVIHAKGKNTKNFTVSSVSVLFFILVVADVQQMYELCYCVNLVYLCLKLS